MNRVLALHKAFWKKEHVRSLVATVVLALVASLIQKIADAYVSNIEGAHVDDLILSRVPTINLNFFVVQGALLAAFLIVVVFIAKPRYILFASKALAVFIIVRSFFISLTHLGIDPNQLQLNTNSIGFGLYDVFFNTRGDFFFSGHTGVPFLIALVMWREKAWRYTFLIISFVLGASVLLSHIHYSIDVFAAPFMTYGIYALSREFFKKDYSLIE